MCVWKAIVNSINNNTEGPEAWWSYVVPSAIPLGNDAIAVGIIYDSNRVVLKVHCEVDNIPTSMGGEIVIYNLSYVMCKVLNCFIFR